MLNPHPPTLDPSQRDRISRSLCGQKRVLEMIAIGEPLESILNAINALIESEGDGLRCSILTLDGDGRLHCAAATSLPQAYNHAIEGVPIGPQAGSCGTAAYLRRRVIVEDIAVDPLWDNYRELAITNGLRACWSEPIVDQDETVLGTFAIYHDRPACPTQQHLELIETAAYLAGIALQRHRNDEILRQSKQAAEDANASKDQFLAVLSHELRTPLMPVLATIQMLESRTDLPADVRPDLATIRRNVQMEGRLIDDLLDLTRIARGKIELKRAVVDVHRLLHTVLEGCQTDLAAKSQQLMLQLHATRHQAFADPARLQQVFWNLLSNAIKFTPRAGKITVSSENDTRHTPTLIVRVSDDGIGIEPHVLPRLFTAFEQGQRRITRQFGGLGLGLTISKALLELQGGRLSASSDGHGKGAVFTIELPVTERSDGQANVSSDSVADAGDSAGSGDGAVTRPSILLVEDHVDTLRALSRALTAMGYSVTAATSVADAVELIEKQPFGLLISDLGLPDGSGLEIMRRLAARHGGTGKLVKSIALSGFGMEEDVRRSAEAGFDRHLVKPVRLDVLDQTIRELSK